MNAGGASLGWASNHATVARAMTVDMVSPAFRASFERRRLSPA